MAAESHPLRSYELRYDLAEDRPWIVLSYDDPCGTRRVDLYPPKEDAVYLADLLRRERRVFYVVTADGRSFLTTAGSHELEGAPASRDALPERAEDSPALMSAPGRARSPRSEARRR